VTSLIVVQALVCGLSAIPTVLCWSGLIEMTAESSTAIRSIVLAAAIVPSYILFALCLMVLSPFSTWITGWRTTPGLHMRLDELGWPLLTWARYMVAIHIVRVFAGTLFRGSPIWTVYLRLNGARFGRRVYVNTLAISDHNLLEFGDDVVIGDDVHVSGHTVESGVVKTGHVRLASRVTIGLGSMIEIDVEVGPDCQVGALSMVPKHTTLEAGAVYAGIPVKRLS
jgi:acetyltransferase-like isoleucine patch superfamily enzyme